MQSKALDEILTEAEISKFSQLIEDKNPADRLLKAVRSVDIENPESINETIDKIRSFDLQIRALLMSNRDVEEVAGLDDSLPLMIYCLHTAQANQLDYAIIRTLAEGQAASTHIQILSPKSAPTQIHVNEKFLKDLHSAFQVLDTEKLLLPPAETDINQNKWLEHEQSEKLKPSAFINRLLTPLQDVIDDVSIPLPDDFRRELENLSLLVRKTIQTSLAQETETELSQKFSFLQNFGNLLITLGNDHITDQQKMAVINNFQKLFELKKSDLNEEIINSVSLLIKKSFLVTENAINELLNAPRNGLIESVEASLKGELDEFFLALRQDAYTRLENGYTLTEIGQPLGYLAQLTVNFLNTMGAENITPQVKQQSLNDFKSEVSKIAESDLEATITKALSKLINDAAAAFIAKPLSKIGGLFYTPPVFSQAISRTESIYKTEKEKPKPPQ